MTYQYLLEPLYSFFMYETQLKFYNESLDRISYFLYIYIYDSYRKLSICINTDKVLVDNAN